MFAAHRTEKVKQLFQEKNIVIVFVPASCTGELQPLDVSGNGAFKGHLKDLFRTWYADQVLEQEKMGKIFRILLPS